MNRLVHEFRELAQDHLQLATLEARLSVITLLRMAVVSMATALVLASAWGALVGAAALWLIGMGLAPVWAMLLLAGANLLLAVLGWLWIRRMSRWLGWPATQRALKTSDSPDKGKRGAE
ncbi:phage holin family protein [Natronospirillum operosum]|nr:phage holin family protein [Natronospirillum operosum]